MRHLFSPAAFPIKMLFILAIASLLISCGLTPDEKTVPFKPITPAIIEFLHRDTVVLELTSQDSLIYFRIKSFNNTFKVFGADSKRIEDMVKVNLMVARDIERQYKESAYSESIDQCMLEMEHHIHNQGEILNTESNNHNREKEERDLYSALARKCDEFRLKAEK